jgi:hypothetical protein
LLFVCGEEDEALQVAQAATQRCIDQQDMVHAAYGRALVGEFQIQLPQYKACGMANLEIVRQDAHILSLKPLCEHIIKLTYV